MNEEPGTYFWHGHAGVEKVDGFFGPLIVRPRGAEPFQYDEERILLLDDNYHEAAGPLSFRLNRRAPPPAAAPFCRTCWGLAPRTVNTLACTQPVLAVRGGMCQPPLSLLMCWSWMFKVPGLSTQEDAAHGATFSYACHPVCVYNCDLVRDPVSSPSMCRPGAACSQRAGQSPARPAPAAWRAGHLIRRRRRPRAARGTG